MNRPTVHANAWLLSVEQAAQESGLSTGTLRRLIADGELPVVRVPGVRRVHIHRRDLEQRISRWKEVAS